MICIKLQKEIIPYADRIMNILVEVFKNKQAVAQVRLVCQCQCQSFYFSLCVSFFIHVFTVVFRHHVAVYMSADLLHTGGWCLSLILIQ